jgi:hypothetical protein
MNDRDEMSAFDEAMSSRNGSRPAVLRFWEKVRKTSDEGCWLWEGQTRTHGYGQIRVMGTRMGTHRFSWRLHNGSIPAGIFVCHHCDNPACVNPAHLFLGTHDDNMADRNRKGRMEFGDQHHARRHPELVARGERNGQAKLTMPHVRAIREAYRAGGLSQRALAAQYGVTQRVIWGIVNNRAWNVEGKHAAF